MTALSANKNYGRRESKITNRKVATATTVYAGGMICTVTASGLVKPHPAAGTAGTATTFAGVAKDGCNNSAGAGGALSVDTFTEGIFEFAFNGTATQAHVGTEVYIKDDGTVTSSTLIIKAGVIDRFVSATKVAVKIDGYVK